MGRNKKDDPDKLTHKQELFVANYLANGGNATQAALSAGYSKKNSKYIGPENLENPLIAKEIRKHQDKTLEKLGVTYEYKIDALRQGVEACLNGKADSFGRININGLVSVIHELNKMQGHHMADKVINTNINSTVDSDVMSELIKKYSRNE